MRVKLLGGLLVIGLLIAVGIGISSAQTNSSKTANSSPSEKEFAVRAAWRSSTLQSPYYFPNQFDEAINKGEALSANFPNQKIHAGIIPHDITQAQFIAHFLYSLKKQAPKTILLIGPNHFEYGPSPLTTTTANWSTAHGTIFSDPGAVKKLLQLPAVSANDTIIVNEHSIAGIIPYLSYYLPQSKVVPLIFKSRITSAQLKELIETVDSILPPSSVIIASVDFSHYLTAQQAINNDKITATALQGLDYHFFLSLGNNFNDYVDSPPAIAFLLAWLEKNNFSDSLILYNTNSGIINNNYQDPITSYFEMVYF